MLYGRHTAIMKPENAHRMRKPFYKLAGLYNISVDDLLHLTIDIDGEGILRCACANTASTDLSEFLEFFNDPSNKKKYMFNTNLERELLFYFDKISDEDKKEIIEFTKIKAKAFIKQKQCATKHIASCFII